MLLKFDQQNYLTIDSEKGCKIQQLTLGGKTIIKFNQNQNFLGSGAYLMFPWVNRVIQNPYQKICKNEFNDGKGYPLHGLYATAKREVKTVEVNQNGKLMHIQLTIRPTQISPLIHSFTQTFLLSENSLQLYIQVHKSPQDPNPFCFGYHPYFQLSGKPLSQLKIQSNLKKHLELQQDLLMKWPKSQSEWDNKIDGTLKYDSLFQASDHVGSNQQLKNYVQLSDGKNSIKVQSDLKYWQIYTASDGKRIAIEPQSFYGNIYEIIRMNPQLKESLPQKGRTRITVS